MMPLLRRHLLILALLFARCASFLSPVRSVLTERWFFSRIASSRAVTTTTSLSCTTGTDTSDDAETAAETVVAAASVSSPEGASFSSAAAMPTGGVPVNYNKYVAALSAVVGSAFFVFQHGQPVNSVALLKAMERDSMDVNVALCNGRPTMVEFYADWCESCKVMAPAMRSLETQYKDRINFITIDGSSPRNADMVKRFGVDAIPHVAFLTPQAEVQTALVGAVPKKILVEEATALVQNQPLPYEGYDAFEESSHFPMEDVTKACRL